MENPWLRLPETAPYVLQEDFECIAQHNYARSGKPTELMLRSLPEPFIGNPHSARVVLLGKNPGHSKDDEKDHMCPEFRKAIFLNLSHGLQDYPFYPMDPRFESKTGAGKWWRNHIRELCDVFGPDRQQLAKGLMVVEWFPYHSVEFARPKTQCASQAYSFQLIEQMRKRGALVVGMRGKMEWAEIQRSGHVEFLNNPRNPCVSKGNTEGDLFYRIVSSLRGNTHP